MNTAQHGLDSPVLHIDEDAPVISRADILISAPLEVIWNIQTNISAWPDWRPSVVAARLDGALQAGTAFHWEEGGLKIISTLQEIRPMHRIVWTGPAQGIDAVHVWEFAATPDGVHVHTEESWVGDVVVEKQGDLQPLLDAALKEWLRLLKQQSEAASANTVQQV